MVPRDFLSSCILSNFHYKISVIHHLPKGGIVQNFGQLLPVFLNKTAISIGGMTILGCQGCLVPCRTFRTTGLLAINANSTSTQASLWQSKMPLSSVQFSSVAHSCRLCDLMGCSTPGLPVHHQFLEFTQTHVHPTISSSVVPFSSRPQSFPASGSFLVSQFFASGVQSIGVSASTSVLLMNTQDSFPWGQTSLCVVIHKHPSVS